MQLYIDSPETHDRESGGGREPSALSSLTCSPGLAFLVLCVLIGLGVTRPLDWWGQRLLAPLSSSLLDLTGFLLTFLGETHITGAVAVVLAVRGWQRQREHGLGPLLLFVGVGLEVLLKYVLPHPGPPTEFAHHYLPSFLRLSAPLLLHVSTPYSFPSGHMLRSTFLVTLTSARKPQWRTLGWLVVAAMAVTRVYCNEHWVSDVVGGALLGWTLAVAATALEHEPKRKGEKSRGTPRGGETVRSVNKDCGKVASEKPIVIVRRRAEKGEVPASPSETPPPGLSFE